MRLIKRRSTPRPEDLFVPTPGHPPETIANLDAIPIRENGDPMVALTTSPGLLIRPLAGPRTRLRARAEVARRLKLAAKILRDQQPAYTLMVVDAWRPAGPQARWHRFMRLLFRLRHPFWPRSLVREAANKFVAAPDAIAPPPHSTGGAVDVRLCNAGGKVLKLGTWNPASCHTDFPGLPDEKRRLRRVLIAAMEGAGFSNYEEEWWHWSYGDSGWALRSNQPHAFYGRVNGN